MNRAGRASVMVCLGVVVTYLLWSGEMGWFVQRRMRYPLIGAAIALLVLGVYEFLEGGDRERENPDLARRAVGPGVGWMLVLPVFVLASVAPSSLGAAAADRVENFVPTQVTVDFEPLDVSNGPAQMRVFDFLDRAIWDADESLDGVTVQLEGLVVNDPTIADGFKLTRFMVSCCAADGVPLQVDVHHPGLALPDDTWVVADLVWRVPLTPYAAADGIPVIEADAIDVRIVPTPPDDPYESPY